MSNSVTVTLAQPLRPLDDFLLDEIAEEALQVAGKEIADKLEASLGGKVWGDFAPEEVASLYAFFKLWVRAFALNHVPAGAVNVKES